MENTFESRRKAWNVIFSDPNLSLNSLRHRAVAGTVCQNGLRSVCWKVFLGYLPTLEVSTWPSIQLEERKRYTDLRRKYIEEPAEKMNKKGEEDLSDNNPLALNDSNPWQQFFADSEIRKVIRQDVERTFPDVDFFREDEVQQRLTDILFIYCKLNRDVSYRQGMHELLAPFYWVLALESLDYNNVEVDFSDPDARLISQILDATYVEHDAYILFDKLMTYGKSWYEFNDDVPSRQSQNKLKSDIMSSATPKPTDSARLNPVVMICHRVYHQYLRTVDPILYRHLENFGIEPQLYGIRWIRLLFGREFEIYELLKLWDAIFAQDPSLQIVDYICLAILLKIRDQLLQKDYAECLTFLMRPPQIKKPATLVEQAKYLQENLTQDAALHILQQNDIKSGKEPRTSLSDGVVEFAPPVNYSRQQQMQRTLHHRSSQGANMDNSFARITSGMMNNPQMRDFNKAIAGVMGSVQKNVNNFGENVLGRSDGLGPRRSTVSSEFPSGIDRVATSFKQERATLLPKSSDDPNFAKTRVVNQQMGELMAKCISMLEDEIFSPAATTVDNPPSKTENIDMSEDNVVPQVDNNSSTADQITNEEDVEKDTDDLKVVSTEEENHEKHKIPAQNEAAIIMALAGLKHVRDVLLGKQQHFDTSVMDTKIGTPDANDDWKWDLVDHKEAVINSPVSSSMDESQPAKRSVFIPQTSASIISNDVDNTYGKDKPLPPIVDQKPPTPTVTVQPKLPQVPITYIPANPTPPKQPIKYSIEDLLSDPDLQLSSPKASTNVKFKWMLSSENEDQSDSNSHFASTDLFKSEQAPRMSPRKRTSFIINKSVPVETGEAIDPLDAKNVDSRRDYEFDMF